MVSRSLARRALLLGIWAAGILFLLQLREPGFWREALRITRPFATAPSEEAARGVPRREPALRERLARRDAAQIGRREAAPVPTPVVVARAPVPLALPRAPTAPVGPRVPVGPSVPGAPPAASSVATVSSAARGMPTRGNTGAARAAPQVAGRPAPSDDLYSRVDAAWKLSGRGAYAEAWKIARTLPEHSSDPQILRLKALSALWAHQDNEALRLARAWQRRDPREVEPRLALAQAHLQVGQGVAARAILGPLARARLDLDQRVELAALQEWAGDYAGAIASSEAVLAERQEPRALHRLARLLEAAGRDEEARDAVARALALTPNDATLELLDARLAAKLGDRARADEKYATYLEQHPGDVDARLEAARYAVNAGKPELAASRYRDVTAVRGDGGLRVEQARALLAANRYAEAEELARAAVDSAEDGPEARLALAQSVYLQGRTRDAAHLFAKASAPVANAPVASAPVANAPVANAPVANAPAAASFQARLAMARDRDLDAYNLLGDQLEGEALPEPRAADSRADLWLLRGRVAEKRGDYRRARSHYLRARDLGAVLGADVALEGLDAATRPRLGGSYGFFADANRLEMNGGTISAELWPNDIGRLTVRALAQVVSQDGAHYTRTGGRVAIDDVYVTPAWALAASVGFVNSSAGGGDIVEGTLGARRFFADGSVAGITAYREPLLGGHDDLDPRLWNRIIDLRALGPSFAVNGGKVYGDILLREDVRDRLWVQGGIENYQDGNLRGIFYAHYQLPVRSGPNDWTVIRPNAFVEAFKRPDEPNYFSPRTHATLGLAGHTVQRHGRFRLEAELNPQLLITNGEPGFGIYGLIDAGIDIGPANLGASAFAFYDSQDSYWLARAMARVVVEL